jgi:hypothetical protein
MLDESESEESRNNAGEMVLRTENRAQKFKKYQELSTDSSVYPECDDYVEISK